MEIGSEFHNNSMISGKNKYIEIIDYPKRYVLSGRTGLSLIAGELKANLNSILLPDYCCGSMIKPFVVHGLDVSFYNAFNLSNVEIPDTVDAVLIMDYFGFISTDTLSFAQMCREKGKVIIVDATQTAFSESQVYRLADYIIVSYRKWFDSLCAVVYSKHGFTSQESFMEHHSYLETWRRAAFLKEKYIKYAAEEKQDFLTMFATANQLLDVNYVGFKASDSEIEVMRKADSTYLRNKRRENANMLVDEINRLSNIYDVHLIYTEIRDRDCPLFVPIMVNEEKRTFIRTELTKYNIYCPCHWPIDYRYPYKETQYHKRELSLICDQRYGIEEMRVQIAVLTHVLDISNQAIV